MDDIWFYFLQQINDEKSLLILYCTCHYFKKLMNNIIKNLAIQFNTEVMHYTKRISPFGAFLKSIGSLYSFKNTNNKITPTRLYCTHWKGATPYKVKIIKPFIDIYSGVFARSTLLMSYKFKKIWMGKNFRCEFNRDNGRQKIIGNSILIYTNNNTYIFIGNQIFSFTPFYPIVNFYSLVGRNDVPYPYAVDTHNNIYLLIEDTIIKMDNLLYQQTKLFDNPYCLYYDHFNKKFYNHIIHLN